MRALFIVLSDAARQPWAEALASACNTTANVFTGSPLQASQQLATGQFPSPSHIVLDIGHRGQDVLGEIDTLAQQCEPGTRVITVGDTNDIQLYRGLLARGVIDYVTLPADPGDVARTLTAPPAAAPVTATPPRRRRQRPPTARSASSPS